jgi:Calx-beta domain
MDERKSTHSKKDDVPIIGDYSNAQDVRLGAELRQRPRQPRQPEEPQSQSAPRAAPPASRGSAEQLRIDPSDVRRHARLRRESERPGPLAKLVRYGAIVALLAVLIAGYWNFDALRGVRLDLSTWTSLFPDGAQAAGGATVPTDGPAIASTAVTSAVESEPPVPVPDTPAPPTPQSAAVAAAPAAPPVESDAGAEAVPSAPGPAPTVAAEAPRAPPPPAAALSVVDEVASAPLPLATPPPAEPEPPPGPESFSFGLRVVNVSESDPSADILVLRNGDRRHVSTVFWWTKPGTATAGVDYVDLGVTALRFAAGEQNRAIHIPIGSDRNVEGVETFYVYLATSEAAAAAGQPDEQLEVDIHDAQ